MEKGVNLQQLGQISALARQTGQQVIYCKKHPNVGLTRQKDGVEELHQKGRLSQHRMKFLCPGIKGGGHGANRKMQKTA